MSQHANRVQMTVTGTPGTGTITLNAATSGYQSFGTAYSSADATVDILITEGTSWEVARNCTYTHSGTTVSRTTPEASSAGGAAVSFGSSAIVSVIATAATGNNWGLNEVQASPTGSNVTGVVGTLHILDISGLTADRDFTLPATCAVGDRIGVFIKTGDADHELLLKPDSTDTINGGAAGAEWSRLFISNECVIFRCITANADWIVEYDGRIPCKMVFRLTTGTNTTEAAATLVIPTDRSGVWTADVNVGSAGTTADSKFNFRRDGTVTIFGRAFPINNITAANYFTVAIWNGTTTFAIQQISVGATSQPQFSYSGAANQTAGNYLQFRYRSQEGSKGLAVDSTFCVMEVLP
jgi:hypothetical protein